MDIPVQRPLTSKSGHLVEQQKMKGVPSRYCSLLEWQEGWRYYKNLTPRHFYKVGQLAARLHKTTSRWKVNYRNYWTADGLLGPKATLGPLSSVAAAIPENYYNHLRKCWHMVFTKISDYQRRNPQKLLLIHADLHFGNIIWTGGEALPIDFDDCGRGFHLYDLAVTLHASTGLSEKQKAKVKALTEALLKGYSSKAYLSQEDIRFIPYFILARKLVTVTWCNKRRNNPNVIKHFNKIIQKDMPTFRQALEKEPKLF